MKKIFFILAISLPAIIMAQDIVLPPDTVLDNDTTLMEDSVHVVLITENMPNAVVHQDSTIIRLMTDKRLGRVRGEQIVDGFRVQVYASNRQQEAKNEALLLHQNISTLLDIPVYAISEPPFWKVRIGNFKTREEANAYKDILLNMFPDMVGSTYVVPDKIILVQ